MDMTAEVVAQLRADFPPEAVGKLPRVTCRDCSNNKREKHCDKHRRNNCQVCHQWISEKHIHLDYVGHAEVTDRFLQVDPEWTWEPFAIGSDGLPALDRNGGMWIRLTIAGVTRPGYGDAQDKEGPDAVKEVIGDALRNAGMRFGVGLGLWGAHGNGVPDASVEQEPEPQPQRARQRASGESVADKARAELRKLCEEKAWPASRVSAVFEHQYQQVLKTTDDAGLIEAFTASLVADPERVLGAS